MWQTLLDNGTPITAPWLGGTEVHRDRRTWRLAGNHPPEYGWYHFASLGRTVNVVSQSDPDPYYFEGLPLVSGYLAGDRFIGDAVRVDPDPRRLVEQTKTIYLVERGLSRFARVVGVHDRVGRLLYARQAMPIGPEDEVELAYIERKPIEGMKGVTPALDLAFRWMSWQRTRVEERTAEVERRRMVEERMAEALRSATTGAGRRELARHDFSAAARAALLVTGAEFLDARAAHGRNEMVVQFRFRNRRFECVVDRYSLGVTDAGVCLDGYDSECTLETLPATIGQAIDEDVLVVWRHV